MNVPPDLATVAAAIGDASRAAMLTALMDGPALPATVLARQAGISAPTASAHLARLVQAGLVTMEREGRERCYGLAGPEVAHALEALLAIAPATAPGRVPPSEQPEAFRTARFCYDHLAGRLGVEVLQGLLEEGLLQWAGRDYTVTGKGERWFRELGVELDTLHRQRRHFARQCLDLTERRYHLAGALAAGLAGRMLELGWIERAEAGRALTVTAAGRTGCKRALGLELSRGR